MPVVVAMLRGINLAKNRRVRMEDLRALYTSLKLRDVRTLVASGNVVFETAEQDLVKLASRLEKAFAQAFGFHSDVILRTIPELEAAIAAKPFGRQDLEGSKLLVTFLRGDPGDEARAKIRAIEVQPEELHITGRELYIYFPNGMGRSALPWAGIDRALKTTGTARNWNSVTKLLALAEAVQAASTGSQPAKTGKRASSARKPPAGRAGRPARAKIPGR
jgi:uncharacterized protein (DUF1697 family)